MDYWRLRELEHIEKQIKNDAVLAQRIRQKYMQAMDEIQNQIEAFYGRYAEAEGISMQEARKRVSKLDMDKYSEKAKRYVKERNFTKRANEEMLLYNVTMKINRLQLLRLNIELELLAAGSDEERILLEQLNKQARNEFERQAGILGESINYNERHINSIVNASFLSATWSDRLWANQTALRAELDKLLHRGIVQGKNPRELARQLRKTFNTSISNSERLLRTEMARVQQDVFQDSMKQANIEQYEYIAEPSACSICAALDGKIFDLKDAEVGVNAFPMHPNCRCSQAGYVDREEWDADLRRRRL
ncbi:minor capsid protein [Ornithinibacillus bavariensis]|uniref:minor capsid protein n=1 Tax=Ornithinibacillus bavariensis TaxID=545502 RepID=UPI000EC899B7|nr:phage head morphogenesis protein [Ornithinibacillus sp.]